MNVFTHDDALVHFILCTSVCLPNVNVFFWQVIARVRAYTSVGAGRWSNASEPRKVVGYPSPPEVTSGASGVSGETFIEVDWIAPVDTGDLRNDTVPILEYQIQFSDSADFLPESTKSAVVSLVMYLSVPCHVHDVCVKFGCARSFCFGVCIRKLFSVFADGMK